MKPMMLRNHYVPLFLVHARNSADARSSADACLLWGYFLLQATGEEFLLETSGSHPVWWMPAPVRMLACDSTGKGVLFREPPPKKP